MKVLRAILILPAFTALCAGVSIRAATTVEHVLRLRNNAIANGDDGASLRQLLALVKAGTAEPVAIRVNAAFALGRIAEVAPESTRAQVIGAILERASDPVPELRRTSYQVLKSIAKASEVPDQLIIGGLRERNSDVALYAAEIASGSGSVDPIIEAALVESIEHAQNHPALEMIAAIRALNVSNSISNKSLELLLKLLDSDNALVVAEAIYGLAKFKPDDDRIPKLIESLMTVPNYAIRLRALDAASELLTRRDNQGIVAVLERAAKDRDLMVRKRAEAMLRAQARL
jgi:hypothetical protein